MAEHHKAKHPMGKTSPPKRLEGFAEYPEEAKASTPKKHHLAYSFFFSPQNPKSPNRFPVIHRANAKLFTIPPDSDPSASYPVDSLLITKGLVNIMDTVEYGTAKT